MELSRVLRGTRDELLFSGTKKHLAIKRPCYPKPSIRLWITT